MTRLTTHGHAHAATRTWQSTTSRCHVPLQASLRAALEEEKEKEQEQAAAKDKASKAKGKGKKGKGKRS